MHLKTDPFAEAPKLYHVCFIDYDRLCFVHMGTVEILHKTNSTVSFHFFTCTCHTTTLPGLAE